MQGMLKQALGLVSVLAIVGAAGGFVISTATPGRAADHGKTYVTGLGDLMNTSLQEHHTKLWIAGHANNWALAAYEVKEMKETRDTIETFTPMWRELHIGEMVKVLDLSLRDMDQAIKAKDGVKFDAAYQEVTVACNACHTAANQPEIIITAPTPQSGALFPDQDFTASAGAQ